MYKFGIMILSRIGDIMNAFSLGLFIARGLTLTNEVFLGMTGHLSWSPCFHCPPRNVPPITPSILSQPFQK